MTDVLAAIDAATGCQHCGGPLGGGPSDDFCCAEHQEAWHAARAEALGTEAMPPVSYHYWVTGTVVENTFIEGRRIARGGHAPDVVIIDEANVWIEGLDVPVTRIELNDDVPSAEPEMTPRERALHLRRTRNTGPALPPLGRR